MDEKKMDPEEQFFIKHTTNLTRAKIDKIRYKVNVNTLEQSAADALELNEIARVIFTTGKPLFFDPYSKNKNTGAFILIDPITNNTSAVGMIIDRVETKFRKSVFRNWTSAANTLQPSKKWPRNSTVKGLR